jgi:cell division protein FtsB
MESVDGRGFEMSMLERTQGGDEPTVRLVKVESKGSTGRPTRRRPTWIVLSVALAVLAVAVSGGGVYVWQHAQAQDARASLTAANRTLASTQAALALQNATVRAQAGRIEAMQRQATAYRGQVRRLQGRVGSLQDQIGSLQNQTAAPTAACTEAAILPAVRAANLISPPMTIASVLISECQGGYARVDATAGNVPPGTQMETEQVFLKDSGGVWRVIDSGTGITCGESDLQPETKLACSALGLT